MESDEENKNSDEETVAVKKNYRRLLDSDSSDEEEKQKSPEKNVESSKNSGSDSDSNSDEEVEKMEEEPTKSRRKGVPKKLDVKMPKEKTKRKSAAAAMESIKDELNANETSERQTDERNKGIRIPYHKPKQYSLKEFLARRTINKPSIEKIKESAAAAKPTTNILKMKMNSEELEKFAQKMKEREQEALEFFKSESESSDEEGENKTEQLNDGDKMEIDEKETTEVAPSDKQEEVTENLEITAPIIETPIVTEELQADSPGKENVTENQPKEEPQLPPVKLLKTLEEFGGKDFTIDLTTGTIEAKKLSGPEMLFQRYLKTINKPKHKDSVCMNILSVENGKLENQKIEIKLDKAVELDHNRPGYAHEQLKENLRNTITKMRLEEVKKKGLKCELEEFEPEEKCKQPEIESEEEYNPENDESASESEEEELDESLLVEKKQKKSQFVDDEAIDEDEEQEDDSEESSDDSDNSEIENNENAPKKGRILKAFVDSDDEQVVEAVNKSLDVADYVAPENQAESAEIFHSQGSQFSFNEPSISESLMASNLSQLFDKAPANSQPDDDELMALCSGQFAATNPLSIPLSCTGLTDLKHLVDTETDDFISQVPERAVPSPVIEELPEESQNIVQKPPMDLRKLLESTDDEAENREIEKPKIKKKKKRRQKTKKLGFSDDDDEESDLENMRLNEDILESDEGEFCEEEEEEEEQILVDYDSEENEIQVKVTKKDRIKLATEFVEKEAELSESEWGSADEDEKGLDRYEMDLADEEQFDQAQLREEVGRIHARKVMDEDIKNVKKIQDLLFEDEENDGVGRERKFRWKNQDGGFTLEDENARDVDLENAEIDEESEINWRRMRHERESLINEQSQKMLESETMSEDIILLDQDSQTVTSSSTSALVKRKFQIIKTTSNSLFNGSGNDKNDSPFLIKNSKKITNNSFLSRGETTLKKIASFMSNKMVDDEVTNMSSHGGGNSMSFAPIEKKPNEDSKKRKSDGSNQTTTNNNNKKRKVESQKFLLLDQLKQ